MRLLAITTRASRTTDEAPSWRESTPSPSRSKSRKSFSVSAERKGEFDLTVKIYPNGRASGYLNRLEIGDTVGFWPKSRKLRNPGTHVALIAYGVGITEILPMAATELAKPEAEQVRLLWASRTPGDTFWRDQIAALEEAYPERFSFAEIISRDPGYAERAGALQGRVTVRRHFSGVHLLLSYRDFRSCRERLCRLCSTSTGARRSADRTRRPEQACASWRSRRRSSSARPTGSGKNT